MLIPAPGILLDVIVVDFFHWPKQGEYCFDPDYLPDLVGDDRRARSHGYQADGLDLADYLTRHRTHFEEMCSRGLLVRSNRGISTTMDFLGVFSEPPLTRRMRLYLAARQGELL